MAIIQPVFGLLADVFAVEGKLPSMGQIFEKMDNKESETQTFEIRQGLAASFGTETNLTNLKQMDDKLKLLIATVLKQVEAIPAEERNWGAIQACFLNCNAARPMQAEPITTHPDPFEVTSESNFKLDGCPDQKIIDQVMNWWTAKAVPNEDIRKDTNIDIDSLAKIVAWSGATVKSLLDVIASDEYHSKKVVDIGLLRFPDMSKPYFTLYHIEVFAYSDCRRFVWHQSDTNGITSTLTYRQFEPREEVIARLKQETIVKAASDVDAMFGN